MCTGPHAQEELGTLRQQYAADLAAVQQHAQQAMDKDLADTQNALKALEATKAACEVGNIVIVLCAVLFCYCIVCMPELRFVMFAGGACQGRSRTA